MMIEDGTYTAVIDRFEGEQVVLLVEDQDDQTQIGELVVDQVTVPEAGQHVDAVLTVELEDGELVSGTYAADETDKRAESATDRFEQLSERLSSADEEDSSR